MSSETSLPNLRASRAGRWLLVSAYLPLCWLSMQVLHEAGHALAAGLSGGSGIRVVLHPLEISRTDVAINPQLAFVTWCGPIAGIVLPLAGWWSLRRWWRSVAFLGQFFAGFCLVANGAYLGMSFVSAVGDAEVLLRVGMSVWLLVAFGLVTVGPGFWLWNGLGADFGWGPQAKPVSLKIAGTIWLLLVAVVAAELAGYAPRG